MSDQGWWNAWPLLAAHLRYDHGMTWAELERRFDRSLRKGAYSRWQVEWAISRYGEREGSDE